jgi:hypothetical protein
MDESGERKPGPFSPWPLPRRRSQIDRRQLHLRTLLRWTHFAARHVLIWINKAARFNLKADPPKASVEQGFCQAGARRVCRLDPRFSSEATAFRSLTGLQVDRSVDRRQL